MPPKRSGPVFPFFFFLIFYVDRVGHWISPRLTRPWELSVCVHNDMVPPAKRNKVDKPDRAEQRFSSVAEISRSLRSQDEQDLLGGAVRHGFSDLRVPCSPWTILALMGLRNQLTVKYNEPMLPPDDGRIRLAREWMETSPGVRELFDLWATTNQVRIAHFLFHGPT